MIHGENSDERAEKGSQCIHKSKLLADTKCNYESCNLFINVTYKTKYERETNIPRDIHGSVHLLARAHCSMNTIKAVIEDSIA